MDLTQLRERTLRGVANAQILVTLEDVDDALNMVQRQFIQPEARMEATALYVTQELDNVEYVQITDLYELRFIKDETEAQPGTDVAILNSYDSYRAGVRRFADTFYLQRMGPNRKFRFFYYQILPDLGVTSPYPVIDERWHDLYWMGAVAHLDPTNPTMMGIFRDRLIEYRNERRRMGRRDPRIVRLAREWV